jgi:hypothetical protein
VVEIMQNNPEVAPQKNTDNKDRESSTLFSKLAVTLLIIAVVVLVSSMVYEYFSQEINTVVKQNKPKQKLEVFKKPPIKPLNMLPGSIPQFKTVTRQGVPGAVNAAEAIYEIEDTGDSNALPASTYVRITYNNSAEETVSKISQAVNEIYSAKVDLNKTEKEKYDQITKASGMNIYLGYRNDNSACYLAWAWENYSIEVSTNYKHNILKVNRKNSFLIDETLIISEQVVNALRQASIRVP